MDVKFPFGPDFIFTILLKIVIFDDLALITGCWVFMTFNIVFVKMLLLEWTVKTFERIVWDAEGKCSFFQINGSIQLIRAGPDQFQGCIRNKFNPAILCEINILSLDLMLIYQNNLAQQEQLQYLYFIEATGIHII